MPGDELGDLSLSSVLRRHRQEVPVAAGLASDQQAFLLHVPHPRPHPTYLPRIHPIAAILQQLQSDLQVFRRLRRFVFRRVGVGVDVRISNN